MNLTKENKMLRMYSIYDRKSTLWTRPFFNKSDADATRGFQIGANDSEIQLGMFPEDFDLFFMGVFNEETGTYMIMDKPLFVVSAISLKKLAKKEVTNEQNNKGN